MPVVNYVLIALNVLVFVVFQGMGANDKFTYKLSTVPAEIKTGKDIVTEDRVVVDPVSGQKYHSARACNRRPWSVYLTLLTSMFMHGGIAHLLGNMWFLWIFGDNVEDRMGHVRYLVFYLLTGLVASLCHVAMNLNGPSSLIPSLGASGAISGVMGAYLALCPSRRVRVLMLRVVTEIPGYMAVGLWFLFQLISGMGLLGGGSEGDGVAYAAHIGGFVAGVLLARPFSFGLKPPQEPGQVRDARRATTRSRGVTDDPLGARVCAFRRTARTPREPVSNLGCSARQSLGIFLGDFRGDRDTIHGSRSVGLQFTSGVPVVDIVDLMMRLAAPSRAETLCWRRRNQVVNRFLALFLARPAVTPILCGEWG